MSALQTLRNLVDPAAPTNPVEALLEVGKTLQAAPGVAKRATRDTIGVPLKHLQVDPDYQRPPDRDKIAAMLHRLRHGQDLDPIHVNQRPDGSLWITDGQHRAAARALNGESMVQAHITAVDRREEPAQTNIMAKVGPEQDLATITRLLGAGAQRDGKRLVLDLGAAGTVTYLSHAGDFVAKSERGSLRIESDCPEDVRKALSLDELVA